MSLCWAPFLPEMHVLTVVLLLQGAGVVWPASASPPLGMTVHVVPLESTQGKTVRAHFTAVVSGTCTDVTGLCADGEDCSVDSGTVPFTGTKPGGGWCAHHWQKTLAANFSGTLTLGSSSEMFVALRADPVVRSTGFNYPAFVALPPPLRANEKCPHHFTLSVKDLDGDRVYCRFARADQGECEDCEPLSFIELDQCSFTFTGDASPGVYYIYLMVEDVVPAPQSLLSAQNKPMSAVPVILSLTVEKAVQSCSAEPILTADNQDEHSVFHMFPFHEKSFTANFDSNQESVLEIAALGPPGLYRAEFVTLGPLASESIAWVRTENTLARLLPVCYVANTQTLQSEPRCVWLYQREISTLPTGTVLTCGEKEMNLVLPVGSLTRINLAELQLNSPDCPVSYNDTHLTAQIPLQGCGTKAVHSGDELIYTNTLKTVRASTQVIRRLPILVLPLACRIPGIQAKGPQYEIGIPKEKEVFGEVEFKLEFHFPGKGPLGRFTSSPVFRTDNVRILRRDRRELRELRAGNTTTVNPSTVSGGNSSVSITSSSNVTSLSNSSNITPPSSGASSASTVSGGNSSISVTSSANVTSVSNSSSATAATTDSSGQIGSKIDTLDLYVMSNCSVARAEIIVSSCLESATADFNVSHPLLDGGCTASESTLEVITTDTGTKIYRLYLNTLNSQGSSMYVRCTVNLCITTQPSQKCPDLCTTKMTRANMVNNVFSSSYTITSDAVSLVYTTAAPTTVVTTVQTPVKSTAATTAATTAPGVTTVITTATTVNTTSHAAEKAPSVAVGAMVALVCVFLQHLLH